jgi:hypothetical protein
LYQITATRIYIADFINLRKFSEEAKDVHYLMAMKKLAVEGHRCHNQLYQASYIVVVVADLYIIQFAYRYFAESDLMNKER